MESLRPVLLLTRSKKQSERFAVAFRARFGADWPIVFSPLTEFAVREGTSVPTGFDNLVFTSENAVNAFCSLSTQRSGVAWCVGSRTAEVAGEFGFKVKTGPGDARGLVSRIISDGSVKKIMWPRPEIAAHDIEKSLETAGIETESIVVYDQIDVAPSDEAKALCRSDCTVLLPVFSLRSAERAAKAFAGASADFFVASISQAVEEPMHCMHARDYRVANRPDSDALLDVLASLVSAAKMG